ncbi:hypothetical protein RclHR1_00900014 [Rhizophagus clarus]|uniref:Kinase-like domain-containing protein n=1 Tax=Rhizophagus clarus TaxID=94130 RepID=A0A2Z6S2L2_9GLOM|nr:hypothetical protein RclHR1_00900014 [Rhizophagus clarus]GES73254.1 kinase-like domain-containing protein [Rhizophagus clarus]
MNTDINVDTPKDQNKSVDDKIVSKEPSFRKTPLRSGNISIDNFILKTRKNKEKGVKWIDFERFENLKQIGEGSFAKVYSATWLDGGKKFIYADPVKKWKSISTYPDTVALKSIKGSNGISTDYMRELEIYHKLTLDNVSLPFYGITKDPTSSEFMLVTGLGGSNLRALLAKSFTRLSWQSKISYLNFIMKDLKKIHERGICHKDLHSGNILVRINFAWAYLTDFGLSGPSDKSSEKIYGVLGYVAPEVLKGKPYCTHADIYSFGIIMTEFSSGFPPYFNKGNMNEVAFVLSICDGLRPDFGKGTPEIYKSLANKCMDANPEKRPTATELYDIITYWNECIGEDINNDDAKKIRMEFLTADEDIPNVQQLFERNSESSNSFNFEHMSKLIDFSEKISASVNDLDTSLIELKLSDYVNEDNDETMIV